MIKPVILSGGKGSRLWPLSRELYPKQYLNVRGEGTLFQQTASRLERFDKVLTPLVICNNEHRFLVAEQIREMEMEAEIVLEPMGRDTAPAVAIAALISIEADPLLFIMPADHIILDEKALLEGVDKAVELAEAGHLVTFGIAPDAPETGYGYLLAGDEIKRGFAVQQFVEKPDEDTAKNYLEQGGYYWNSGMFLMRASVYLRELEKFAPEMLDACRKAVETRYDDLDFIRLGEEAFAQCPAKSVDYAVMEKTSDCAMVPLSAGWSDLGSWTSLHQAGEKDENDNVTIGDILTFESKGCYLQSEQRLMAAVGLEDIIAVETADAILVAHKDKTQNVKNIVDILKKQKRNEAVAHSKVYRPWGTFESIAIDGRFQVKRIMVKPGQVLSLQMHHHRAEHWIVVNGTALVTVGEKEFLLTEDQSTYISVGQTHRLENPGKVPLEIIEIQTGSYLGEDDIVRFEDVYGRKS